MVAQGSQVLTIITRVNALSQQEAAELVLSVLCVLDLHQVRCHAKRVVLQVPLTLLTATGSQLKGESHKVRMINGICIHFM